MVWCAMGDVLLVRLGCRSQPWSFDILLVRLKQISSACEVLQSIAPPTGRAQEGLLEKFFNVLGATTTVQAQQTSAFNEL